MPKMPTSTGTAQAAIAAAVSSRRAPAPARLSASKSRSLVAYVVLAVLCAASGAAPRARAQTCFTSIVASSQDDADQCVKFVRTKGYPPCCQTEDSGCTTMAFKGTAAVDIYGPQHTCTTCTDAGDQLNRILANCVATFDGVNRVAGYIMSGDLTFMIRSNP